MKIRYFYLLLVLSMFTSCAYFYKSDNNVAKEGVLYIYPNSTYSQVLDSIQTYVKDIEKFDAVAQLMEYDKTVIPGKYKIALDDTNESLVNRLQLGEEEPVKLMIRNSPTIFHLARDASKDIIADSTAIVNAILENARFKEENLDLETSKIYFIPNTYFFKWITSGDQFVERMITEHDKFWDDDRKAKLKASGLTELEVYTLASIVQMEASKADEQPKVARAYLNRLKIGMKLQADPTSVYAYKLEHGFNQSIQRVYHKHLNTASDYNTYQIVGLPPAPITLPNGTAIDAVLEPDDHDFVYFVADPDNPGYHSFSSTYAEHQAKANKYRTWLRENDIK
ncbi:endolytic transglycosylase MltG [Flavobacteriaceae bacterium Ap0902]|nr:endolytic transglycosylase MltG [Flavobacteriaceae bacterium Ap0902]